MDEPLGILFENPLMDQVKTCQNKCIFCFIDQLPKNLRSSLYLKDDDSRLSFLMGNYLTLTNMKKGEIEKIKKFGISPLKISIHTTNTDLRVKMLKNKNAGKILDILNEFKSTNIEIDCQIVLVPGYNDKVELFNTISDLIEYHPTVRSVAVVPVGITKYRKGLVELRGVTKEESRQTIESIHKIQNECLNKLKTRFVFLGDEFYLKAGTGMPSYEAYEDFNVLDNGVGMLRVFEKEVVDQLELIEPTFLDKKITIVTGYLAYDFMKRIASMIVSKVDGLDINVKCIRNEFFGPEVTVSGLITGVDIMNQLDVEPDNVYLLPNNMFKKDEFIFLDNTHFQDLVEQLGVVFRIVEVSGKALIKEMMESERWEDQ
jgi:putative radical SAM enzyme (TIGR03279 family)